MNCKKCGAPIPGSANTCPYCGNPVEAVPLSVVSDEATDFAEKDENDYSTTPDDQTEFAGDAFLPEEVPTAPARHYKPPHEIIPQRQAAPQSKHRPRTSINKQTVLRIILLVVLAILILLLIFIQLVA